MPLVLKLVWAAHVFLFVLWKSWVHFRTKQAALQQRIMEQQRMIALTKGIITLLGTCVHWRFFFAHGIILSITAAQCKNWAVFVLSGQHQAAESLGLEPSSHTMAEGRPVNGSISSFLTIPNILLGIHREAWFRIFSCQCLLFLFSFFFPSSLFSSSNWNSKTQKHWEKRTIKHSKRTSVNLFLSNCFTYIFLFLNFLQGTILNI